MYCLGREYTWLLIYLLPLFLSFNDWKYLPYLVLLLFNCGIIFFERYCLWSTVAKPVKYECSNQKVTSVLILKNLEKNQGLNYPYTLVLLGKRSLKFLNTWPLTHVLFVLVQISKYTPTYGWLVSTCFPTVLPWSIFCWKQLKRIYLKWPPEVCDFHYCVCVCAYIAEALVLVSCMVTQKFKFGNNTYRWNVGFFTVKMLFWQWMKHITSTKH